MSDKLTTYEIFGLAMMIGVGFLINFVMNRVPNTKIAIKTHNDGEIWIAGEKQGSQKAGEIKEYDIPASNHQRIELYTNDGVIATRAHPSQNEIVSINIGKTSFIDHRDSQQYEAVAIGNLWWMTRNLNYNLEGSVVYDNLPVSSWEYGRLYTWEMAKKACPDGWRLATDEEWQKMTEYFGGCDDATIPFKYLDAVNAERAGTSLVFDQDIRMLISSAGMKYSQEIGEGRFSGASNSAYQWTSTDAGIPAVSFKLSINTSNKIVRNMTDQEAKEANKRRYGNRTLTFSEQQDANKANVVEEDGDAVADIRRSGVESKDYFYSCRCVKEIE